MEANQPMYKSYAEVPWYRKSWYALLCGIFFIPGLLLPLLTGNIYYQKNNTVYQYSKPARIFLLILSLLITITVIVMVINGPTFEGNPNSTEQPADFTGDKQPPASAQLGMERTEAPSNQQTSHRNKEAEEQLSKYFLDKTINCNGSTLFYSEGNYILHELKNIQYEYKESLLSDVDRLNGLAWKGEFFLTMALRMKIGDQFRPWEEQRLNILAAKRNGRWEFEGGLGQKATTDALTCDKMSP